MRVAKFFLLGPLAFLEPWRTELCIYIAFLATLSWSAAIIRDWDNYFEVADYNSQNEFMVRASIHTAWELQGL